MPAPIIALDSAALAATKCRTGEVDCDNCVEVMKAKHDYCSTVQYCTRSARLCF